jgi:hypothetical protein
MAILQDRLSIEPVPDTFVDPDGRTRATLNEDWEAGPKAPVDTSEGVKYQAWKLTFAGGTFTITPEDFGSPVAVLEGQDSVQCCLAFDQNARPTLAWIDSLGVGYLYWYDTSIADFTITDWGSVGSIALYLDDKRPIEIGIGASDILFWYTVYEVDHWVLYHRKQRDRYTVPHEMKDPSLQYIFKSGMHKGLRGQLEVASMQSAPSIPIVPPGPSSPQENLDFELGDIYWNKTGDFAIDQSDPFEDSWSAVLNTTNYSTLENNVYTSLAPGSLVSISCMAKGTVVLGIRFYNSAKSLITTDIAIESITVDWTQILHSTFSPANAVYMRLFVESDDIISLDNFIVE